MMIHRRILAMAAAVLLLPVAGFAACNSNYVAQPRDTLFSIAQAQYGDHEKWTLIYYSNQAALKGSVLQVEPGMELFIPCAPGDQTPDATPLRQDNAALKFLTGGNYSPFTDRDWPGDGMITELVNAAMEATPDPVTYSITWEDDWSKHLFPNLDEKKFDMGFPWLKPDCVATPNNERCANFHFSEPLMKLLIMLFVRADDGFAFDSDADIVGKTLCRPKGYFTHDLDRAGRRWLVDGLITLVQAESPDACFDLLVKGEVDAVTINVFLGASKINSLGLRGRVVPLERPLSEEGLYVVISKKHWRGTTFLYRFNAGLAALKATDRYNEIVSRHLGIFWDSLKAE
jgi:polar amino acid transport system substrate-binding protein